MTTEKFSEGPSLQDIEIAHLENSFRDLEEDIFPDKDRKLTEKIEEILNKTESSEVMAFGVINMLKMQDLPQHNSHLRPWGDLDDLLERKIKGDLLYEEPEVAEYTICENLQGNPLKSIDHVIKILEEIGKRDPQRQEKFINDLIAGKYPEEVYLRIVGYFVSDREISLAMKERAVEVSKENIEKRNMSLIEDLNLDLVCEEDPANTDKRFFKLKEIAEKSNNPKVISFALRTIWDNRNRWEVVAEDMIYRIFADGKILEKENAKDIFYEIAKNSDWEMFYSVVNNVYDRFKAINPENNKKDARTERRFFKMFFENEYFFGDDRYPELVKELRKKGLMMQE